MIWFGLALALVMVYAGIIGLAFLGWIMPRKKSQNSSGAGITVVVPFRNEEKNLGSLLKSFIGQQAGPPIILVNDHSTDASLQVIEKFRAQNPGMKIEVLFSDGEGKKAASATGLKAVKTPYVFFTDADCVIPDTGTEYTDDTDGEIKNKGFFFFSEITAICGESDVDFFYGPVVYGNNGERTNALFFLDQLALNAVALGLGKCGIHTYCSGAHMGGKTVSLQTAIPVLNQSKNLSGDDVTYLQEAVRQTQKIVALTDRELMVYTAAPAGWKDFFGQRVRWGQKAPGYTSWSLKGLSALVWAVCLVVLMVLVGCFSGILTPMWWAIPTIKLCIDLLFLFLVTLRLSVHARLWAFLPAWVLNLMYIPVVAVLGFMTNTSWKGRKVKPKSVPVHRDEDTLM
jgi:hypothetical protein